MFTDKKTHSTNHNKLGDALSQNLTWQEYLELPESEIDTISQEKQQEIWQRYYGFRFPTEAIPKKYTCDKTGISYDLSPKDAFMRRHFKSQELKKINTLHIPDALLNDRDFVLERVKQHGCFLNCVADQFKGDISVVLAAVKENGWALEYATPELKNNPKIVLAAVQQAPEALKIASKNLQNDSDFLDKVSALMTTNTSISIGEVSETFFSGTLNIAKKRDGQDKSLNSGSDFTTKDADVISQPYKMARKQG